MPTPFEKVPEKNPHVAAQRNFKIVEEQYQTKVHQVVNTLPASAVNGQVVAVRGTPYTWYVWDNGGWNLL